MTNEALPVAFHFLPSDAHLVGLFLKHLQTFGRPLPATVYGFIHDIDIYGTRFPWEIAAELPEEQRFDFYIFTKVKKLTKGRFKRTLENEQGTWKGQKVTSIVGSEWVGEKRMLSFLHGEKKKKKQVTSHWNMDEYQLLQIDGEPVLDDADGSRWVICHVKHSKGKKRMQSSTGYQENATKKRAIPQQAWVGVQQAHEGSSSSHAAGVGHDVSQQDILGNGRRHEVASDSRNMFGGNQQLMAASSSQQQHGAGQHEEAALQSWDMSGYVNQHVEQTDMDDYSQPIAASQPRTTMDESSSWSELNNNDEDYLRNLTSEDWDEIWKLVEGDDQGQILENQYVEQTAITRIQDQQPIIASQPMTGVPSLLDDLVDDHLYDLTSEDLDATGRFTEADQVEAGQSSFHNDMDLENYEHFLTDPAAEEEALREFLKQQGLI